jgi:hypothetical protein
MTLLEFQKRFFSKVFYACFVAKCYWTSHNTENVKGQNNLQILEEYRKIILKGILKEQDVG